VEDLSFKHVIGRVTKTLLEQAEIETDSEPLLFSRKWQPLAGTAREMIGRSLKALEENGAIRVDPHRISIADKESPREMAEAVA